MQIRRKTEERRDTSKSGLEPWGSFRGAVIVEPPPV